MNFFEQELRKIVGPQYPDATYVGRACYVRLGDTNRAKIQFVTGRIADQYETLKVTVLNSTEGEVDRILFRFRDLLGKKQVDNPYFRDGVSPHIWINGDKAEWYAYQPNRVDLQVLGDAISNYLGVFQSQEQTMKQSSAPKYQQTMSM
jgi:hypothetical protein